MDKRAFVALFLFHVSESGMAPEPVLGLRRRSAPLDLLTGRADSLAISPGRLRLAALHRMYIYIPS